MFGENLPYYKEWDALCKCSSLKCIQQLAFKSNNFRSVYWRFFLNILPVDTSKWTSVIKTRREGYESLYHQYVVIPGGNDNVTDLNINNPLSQDEHSTWNQYFEDSETKRIIRQDVVRTFPEIDFFQTQRIQDMMVSILFCYARKYPDTYYVQGMHEILAPLVFVINVDHQSHAQVLQDSPNLTLLRNIMDPTYLEHDVYVIFETVMSRLSHWYEDGQPKFNIVSHPTKLLDAQPFQKPQDNQPTTMIVKRLTKVHNELLKEHEPLVYEHLEKFEILPQLYGIRWTRLMFGREFVFSDLLIIWDAIFSDPLPKFNIIEYLIVALLMNIKDKLLSADYIESMKYLMQYPPSSNVKQIINTAFHFREPVKYPLLRQTSEEPASNVKGILRSSHGNVSRSTSLPRSHHASMLLKRRQQSDLSCLEKRRSAQSMDPLQACSSSLKGSLKSRESVTNGYTNPLGEASVASTIQSEERNVVTYTVDRPMDELVIVHRSSPIRSPQHPKEPNSTSSDEDLDPSFPQKKVLGTRRSSSSKHFPVVSPWHSQTLLTNFETLERRLREVNIYQDLAIRTALGNMRESLAVLFDYKSTMASPRSPPAAQEQFHPLMPEDED